MKTASEAARAAAAAALLVAVLAPFPAREAAAQRGASRVSISRARSYFDQMHQAWRELLALHAEPGDASGAVAAWDHTWRTRVARVERLATRTCLDLLADELASPADCGLHETHALLCNAAFDVSTRRGAIYEPPIDTDLPDPFEARLAIADEAARRRSARQSCEDLPDPIEIDGSPASGWRLHDGRPLLPPVPSP